MQSPFMHNTLNLGAARSQGGGTGIAPHTYTTLPALFSSSPNRSSRARLAAVNNNGGSRSARGGYEDSNSVHKTASGIMHSARTARQGGSQQNGMPPLKPPLPDFKKKSNNSSNAASNASGGRKIASNVDMKKNKKAGTMHLRGSSDEATIGSDGTVTFGPGLSLLMSSLAVRFDDNEPGVGDGEKPAGVYSLEDPSSTPSYALLSSRKRAERKKKEWNTMNALYAKAMEDKQTSKEQSQWFMARFSYPTIYQPAPVNGTGTVMPPGAVKAMNASNSASTLHSPTASASALTSAAGMMQADPHHAHLLHSSASFLQKNHEPVTNNAAVSVEEEPEELEDDQDL